MATNIKGYGICGAGLAHRVSYETFIGPIPDGLNVCHHCDVRSCINPSHLFVGTQADNVADAARKGRMKGPDDRKGESHPLARLTQIDVLQIRKRYAAGGLRQKDLATEYGVGQSQIGRIISGARWAA